MLLLADTLTVRKRPFTHWLHQLKTSFKKINLWRFSPVAGSRCAEGRRRVTRSLAEAASGRCRPSWRFYKYRHSAKTSDSASKTWTNENWVSYNSLLFQELQTLVAFTSPCNHIIWHPENVCLAARNSTTPAVLQNSEIPLKMTSNRDIFTVYFSNVRWICLDFFSVFWIVLVRSVKKP